MLRQSGCRLLLAATEHKTSDYAAMVAEVRPQLPELETVVFLGTADWDERRAKPLMLSPAEAEFVRRGFDRDLVNRFDRRFEEQL